jgi:hypothetical protein
VTGGTYYGYAINPLGGNVGVGTSVISAKFHVIGTTEQLRLGYNASNFLSTTVSSTGSTTFALTGTSPKFIFNNPVNINSSNKLFFGTSASSSISYDGTNMVINPKDVGSGIVNVTGNLSSSQFAVNGVNGLTGIYQILKDVDLVGLTKTYCNQTFTGGILTNTTC